jgi:hypothetical protein
MGKGSGTCQRPAASLEASDSASPELNLSGGVALNEINTTLKLQRTEHRWWTKDDLVSYQKTKEGWIVDSISDPVCKVFREYGLTSPMGPPLVVQDPECTFFSSLKAARQTVSDVSLEVGLNIDSRLTRQKYVAYKIGDLPLSIKRDKDHWWVHVHSSSLPQSLKKHFNTIQGFHVAWASTDIGLAHYPTQKAAHQAVINWLSQTIAKK